MGSSSGSDVVISSNFLDPFRAIFIVVMAETYAKFPSRENKRYDCLSSARIFSWYNKLYRGWNFVLHLEATPLHDEWVGVPLWVVVFRIIRWICREMFVGKSWNLSSLQCTWLQQITCSYFVHTHCIRWKDSPRLYLEFLTKKNCPGICLARCNYRIRSKSLINKHLFFKIRYYIKTA